jgi:chitinase
MYLAGGCHKFSDSVDLDNTQAASCSPMMKVGFDKAGCKGKNVSRDSIPH